MQTFEQAFGVKDVTSGPMARAIKEWFRLYYNGPEDEREDDCQRLPYVIVNKLTKTVFAEYAAGVRGQGPKARFMADVLEKADALKREALQQALIGGEMFIKPVMGPGGLELLAVRRDRFIPLERGADGRITSVGTAEATRYGGAWYTLLERRTVRQGWLTVENKLYRARDADTLGEPVPLQALEKYAALQPETTLPEPIGNLGMAALKTPMFNCVDGSADGVAVYAPAVKLIRHIAVNEQQLNDEFENGRSRIFVSDDLLETDGQGPGRFTGKVFTGIDDNPGDVGVSIFSPALREASYLARKTEYLRNIESLIGFKRGILSEVEAAERTATEITSSEGDYNLTIQDFQRMWERTLRELLATCDALGRLYGLCDRTPFDVQKDLTVDWGNGVLFDADKEGGRLMQMVQAGLLKPEIAVAYQYDLPWDTPEAVAYIRQTYMPEIESMLAGGE